MSSHGIGLAIGIGIPLAKFMDEPEPKLVIVSLIGVIVLVLFGRVTIFVVNSGHTLSLVA